jgi:hypothetical protein
VVTLPAIVAVAKHLEPGSPLHRITPLTWHQAMNIAADVIRALAPSGAIPRP